MNDMRKLLNLMESTISDSEFEELSNQYPGSWHYRVVNPEQGENELVDIKCTNTSNPNKPDTVKSQIPRKEADKLLLMQLRKIRSSAHNRAKSNQEKMPPRTKDDIARDMGYGTGRYQGD